MQKKILYTIGSSQKSLRQFVSLLLQAGVTKVIDIRLHNTSQLAGFAKKDDLAFILETFGIEYEHVPALAPTEDIMKRFRKVDRDWQAFQDSFIQLMQERQAEQLWLSPIFASEVNCLLCAEPKAKRCQAQLVAEYYQSVYPEIEVRHLE